jgi:predicted nucleotide-binding protein
MQRFKTYINEDGIEKEFTVLIIHGHSEDWRIVERHINKKLDYKTLVLKENYRPGETLIEKLEDAVLEECDCAVAIMTPDDQMADGSLRARQNVLYEIGFCHNAYDRDGVIILRENLTEIMSDLHGLVTINYSKNHIEATFLKLEEGLDNIYEELKEYGE